VGDPDADVRSLFESAQMGTDAGFAFATAASSLTRRTTVGSSNHESRKDRREPAIELNEEPAIVVRKTSATLQLTPQDDQLMSERGILSL
jgi:predicted phage tail protein